MVRCDVILEVIFDEEGDFLECIGNLDGLLEKSLDFRRAKTFLLRQKRANMKTLLSALMISVMYQ